MLQLIQRLHLKALLARFHRDEKGLTIVEYAVAGSLITLFVVGAFQLLGTNVDTAITQLAENVGGPVAPPPAP